MDDARLIFPLLSLSIPITLHIFFNLFSFSLAREEKEANFYHFKHIYFWCVRINFFFFSNEHKKAVFFSRYELAPLPYQHFSSSSSSCSYTTVSREESKENFWINCLAAFLMYVFIERFFPPSLSSLPAKKKNTPSHISFLKMENPRKIYATQRLIIFLLFYCVKM